MATSADVVLDHWMVGLVAVACFLVIAFGFVLFNTYVCSKMSIYEDDFEEDDEYQAYATSDKRSVHEYDTPSDLKVVTTEL